VEWFRFFLSILVGSHIPFSFRSRNVFDPLRTKSDDETLADATPPLPCFYPHSEWAALRPGAIWGPIISPRSITPVTDLGLLGAAIYRAILNRPAIETQSPEQGAGCRCLPNLHDQLWFPHHQLLSLPSETNAFNSPLAFDVFASPKPATQPPLALSPLTGLGAAAHTPLHSPTAGAGELPTSGPPLPLLSSRILPAAFA
jgi:hypothetical protein